MSSTWTRARPTQAPAVLETTGHGGTVALAVLVVALVLLLSLAL